MNSKDRLNRSTGLPLLARFPAAGSFLYLILFPLLISCSQPPNVILIMADDMGAECLSLYGGISYDTPNLEAMAAEGMVVSHCIAQPLCTPSRVKLMTGLSNAVNYTHFGRLDTSWLNMGTVMKEAGYSTCITGKWQLNGLAYRDQFPDWNDPTRPIQMGFEEYCLWQLTHARSEGERFADPLIEQNGEVLETTRDDYGPEIFTNYLLDFIERNKDEAFFAYFPMVLVHEPFVPTPDSEDWKDPEGRFRRDTAYFRDMMAYTDRIIGQIRQKLAETGQLENTLLIFTADNGTDRNIVSFTRDRRVNGSKGMTISDGVRVPLVLSWPANMKGGQRFEGLVEFSDFYATLADLVDRDVTTTGKSFLPLLEGKDYEPRKSAFVHYDPRWGEWVSSHRNVFLQTMDYKLYQDGSFYHMKSDVLEQTPLDTESLGDEARSVYDLLNGEMRQRKSQFLK